MEKSILWIVGIVAIVALFGIFFMMGNTTEQQTLVVDEQGNIVGQFFGFFTSLASSGAIADAGIESTTNNDYAQYPQQPDYYEEYDPWEDDYTYDEYLYEDDYYSGDDYSYEETYEQGYYSGGTGGDGSYIEGFTEEYYDKILNYDQGNSHIELYDSSNNNIFYGREGWYDEEAELYIVNHQLKGNSVYRKENLLERYGGDISNFIDVEKIKLEGTGQRFDRYNLFDRLVESQYITDYDNDDNPEYAYSELREYDEDGHLITKLFRGASDGKTIDYVIKEEYEYDSLGNLILEHKAKIEDNYLYPQDELEIHSWEYDLFGDLIYENYFHQKDSLHMEGFNEQKDLNKNIIFRFNRNGKILDESIKVYNNLNNNLELEMIYNSQYKFSSVFSKMVEGDTLTGTMKEKNEYFYDDENKVVAINKTRIAINKHKFDVFTEVKYDSLGNLILETSKIYQDKFGLWLPNKKYIVERKYNGDLCTMKIDQDIDGTWDSEEECSFVNAID